MKVKEQPQAKNAFVYTTGVSPWREPMNNTRLLSLTKYQVKEGSKKIKQK